MPAATFLPDLMTRSACSMREALQELESPTLSLSEASRLVVAVLGLAEGFRAAGKSTIDAFERGLDHAKACALGEANWKACAGWLALLEDVRALVREAGPDADWAVSLEKAITEAEAAKAEATSLRAFLARPLPPFDPQALERTRAAYERGERGEDLAVVLARLEAGGEL